MRFGARTLLPLFLCLFLIPAPAHATLWWLDADGDGYGDPLNFTDQPTRPPGYVDNALDCDDTHFLVFPGAPELCDGVDNDCDGDVDEDVVYVDFYQDLDGDRYGTYADVVNDCSPPPGYALWPGDCDDTASAVHPGAVDGCNGLDDDCDSETDEDGDIPFYLDLDGDGYGTASDVVYACDPPAGYAVYSGDCDDGDPDTYPGAPEVCDGRDNDCDTQIDEDGDIPFYRDEDGDGYGIDDDMVLACFAPPGYAPLAGDCDDTNDHVYPGAPEFCDGIDNDCDTQIDEDAALWYADADADGYGDPATGVLACDPPPGYVDNDLDCDDTNFGIHPGAVEICDGRDNDCNGTVDDGLDPSAWYPDRDGDGFGRAVADGDGRYYVVQSCIPVPGFAQSDDDPDDRDPWTYPGAPEVCDQKDNDGDGLIDEGLSTATFYADADHDGFGDPNLPVQACGWRPGLSVSGDDPDDQDPYTYPGAPELCDDKDNDGDGQIDEDVVEVEWYEDLDNDGWGDGPSLGAYCQSPLGLVENVSNRYGDCDDNDPWTHPGAPETCSARDNDCDGEVAGPLESTEGWYDDDYDDWGSNFAGDYCPGQMPWYLAPRGGDCDDGDPFVYPNALELCDGIDNDCDGETDTDAFDLSWYVDADGDGFGDAGQWVTVSCRVQPGLVPNPSDCDDAEPQTYPGAGEVCDGLDNDCDGEVDEGVLSPWYRDADEDFWGTEDDVVYACGDETGGPAGYVPEAGDCDDNDPSVHPGATEYCNGRDDDCDGLIDEGPNPDGTYVFYRDADQDGFGLSEPETYRFCTEDPGPGWANNDLDCDDENPEVYPGAEEVCDGLDNDCDGVVDEGCFEPALVSIEDVGNDQGRRVRVRWLPPESLDRPGASPVVTGYALYRRVEAGLAPQDPAKTTPPGEWDYVLGVPATGESQYSTVATTLCDSNAAGICWSHFFVRALTADPMLYFDAAPDSGYSIDNLAPEVPEGLAVRYDLSTWSLQWLECPDEDFQHFRIYRGTSPDFTPDPTHLVHATTATSWTDPASPENDLYYYKVSAVDLNGNESAAAAPSRVTDAGTPQARRFALHPVRPNPFNPRTTIAFELPAAVEDLRLEVYDLAGRRIAVLATGPHTAGPHEVIWEARDHRGRALASGVYLCRLRAGEGEAVRRMTLVR